MLGGVYVCLIEVQSTPSLSVPYVRVYVAARHLLSIAREELII